MKALIVGLGSIGSRHARNLRELGASVCGFDPDPGRRGAFLLQLPEADTCDTLEAGLERSCDFAVIASPNAYHLSQSIACARAGLDLFIEKPLAVSTDGVGELAREVANRQLVVLMGSNWKFHPGPMHLKRIVEEGGIGRPVAVQAAGGQYLPDWHPWEDYRAMYSSRRVLGGGVLLDSHDVDYLAWLCGPVESIACIAKRTGTLEIETEDLAGALMTFASGVIATLQLDYLQRPYARRVHLTATLGTAIWDFPNGTVRVYDAGDRAWHEFRVPEDYDLNTMYVDEMRHFVGCCRDRAPTVTPLSQAMHVLLVLDAAAASSRSGGAPMTIAPPTGPHTSR